MSTCSKQSSGERHAWSGRIDRDLMIPELLSRYPQVRAVLDRHGLSGCGGPLGPWESIGFFARAHEVEESALLKELNDALADVDTTKSQEYVKEDATYRPFFLAAILSVLTVGASWGAWILYNIGQGHSFTGVSLQEVNAHGQAQVFGWMGLFMMGFAYQAFPRFAHTQLTAPRLVPLVFWLLVLGIVTASIGITLGGTTWSWMAVAGSAAELAAVSIFSWQMTDTFLKAAPREFLSGRRQIQPYVAFILCGLFWFLASSCLNLWHVFNTLFASSRDELLWYVATYQGPLRDMQFHGLGMAMIFGVSLKALPNFFGFEPVSDRRALTALGLLAAGTYLEIVLFLAYRLNSNHWYAAALEIPWLMLIIAAGSLAVGWKIWRPFSQKERCEKFIKTSYLWLALSLLLLVALPVYQHISHIPFSHAYYGAIRHAITVGFISLSIMGFSAKVVPTLKGVRPDALSQLWIPFILINTGCCMRVFGQISTDWFAPAFSVIGLSGILEVTALALWGFDLSKTMLSKPPAYLPDEHPSFVEKENYVSDVITWFPELKEVFLEFGFDAVANPLVLSTMGKAVTIETGCRIRQVEVERFVAALNRKITPDGKDCTRCCADCTKQDYSLDAERT